MLSITLFVDADSTAPAQDGLDWGHAYSDLQSALTRAAELNSDDITHNDVEAIWIAEGTYLPTTELESGDARSATFSLVDGVTLYGGFAGAEATLDQRDLSAHTTILSGDLGVSGDSTDNAYTVVYCGEDVTAVLDGVAVTGGNADGTEDSNHPERNSGGGIFSEGTLAIVDLAIRDNFANANGGGIYNTATGRMTFEGVEVSENSAFAGAGIYNEGTLIVDSATINGNTTNSYSAYYDTIDYNENGGTLCLILYGKGGGIYSSGTLSISNSVILNNTATQGGGICNDGELRIQNSSIVGNQTPAIAGTWTGDNEEARFSSYMYGTIVEKNKGGGIFNTSQAMLSIEDTEVSGNSAIFGAGIYNEGTIVLAASTILENSTPGSSGSVSCNTGGEGNDIDQGVCLSLWGKGGGIFNSGTLNVSGSIIVNNIATEGGGICNYGNASIETTTFSDNKSAYGAGIANRGELKVANSQFQENLVACHYAHGEDFNGMGAGLYNYDTGIASVVNSLFAKNKGHGVVNQGQMVIVSSTIVENRASSGAGIYASDREGTITELYNTIVAGNETREGAWGFQGNNPDVGGAFIGSNNLIGDGTGLSGLVDGIGGNQIGTTESPLDPGLSITTQEETGLIQYELLPDSPAIDAGDNSLAVDSNGNALATDLYGNARVSGNAVDIGAVEAVTSSTTAAQTYVVTSLENTVAEDGVLTFLEAFLAANSNHAVGDAQAGSYFEQDVIQFADGLQGTIVVDGELVISDDLRIEGPDGNRSVNKIAFDAQGQNRVFTIAPDVMATLTGINITGGSADNGGGIYNLGTLTVTDCRIVGNTVEESGGGIYNAGTLTVTNSSILNNSTPDEYEYPPAPEGCYVYYAYMPCCGGGIYNSGDLAVVSSTIAGNSAEHCGGICNVNGTLAIVNSTISGNNSGVFNVGRSAIATLNNTIVAENAMADIFAVHRLQNAYYGRLDSSVIFYDLGDSVSGEPITGSNNFIGKSALQAGLVDGVDGNQVGTVDAPLDPMLSELVQFGNGQWGYYPLSDSPVIDAGDNDLIPEGITTDISGNSRIYDGIVDIGAFEFVPVILTVTDVSLIPEGEVLIQEETSFTPPENVLQGVATVPQRSEMPTRQMLRPAHELTDAVFAEAAVAPLSLSAADLIAFFKDFQTPNAEKLNDKILGNGYFALELDLYVDVD